MYDNLPQSLKATGSFCGYKLEQRDGKPTKVPYDMRTRSRAQSNNKGTFCDYATAIAQVGSYDGLGVGVFDGLSAIDIDHCVKADGTLTPFAADVVETMDSYAEHSPSGKGVRILFAAEGFEYDKAFYYINNRKVGLEVYVCGATNKFLTVTGNVLRARDIEERSEALRTVLDKYMKRPKPIGNAKPNTGKSYLSDTSVLEKLAHSKQAEKFSKLWNGDISGYDSPSDADMALAGILAFWCGGDVQQMDRLFRQSGLMRGKWDRPLCGSTYGAFTLGNAVALAAEFYKPIAGRSASEDFNDTVQDLKNLRPESNDRYAWTDIGASRLFADCYQSVARYVPERRLWHCYESGIWKPDTGNLKVMELCKALADALLIYAVDIQDERQRNAFIDYCRKWQQRKYREVVLKDAQGVYPIAMSEFDRDPFIFNCANGTLHLDTMEFTPHSSEDQLTKISPVKYDPTARCERFEGFVNEITSGDADKARFLQKALGYGISGDTRYECLFVLYGATTRNGKGTMCESVLRVLGSYGCTARPETISLKNNTNSANPSEDIARLAGVRFANISEPSRGLVLNAAQVKSMTGNDTINARFLHENSFDFAPQFKLYINANYLPVINDMTLFSSGRVIIIPFERHFAESEQDKTLKREFAKAKNQSAILNWLVKGYRLLAEEGFTQPDSVKSATDSYRHDSDKIALFMEDALEKDPNGEERTSSVYFRYQRWCAENGHYTENIKNFKQALMSTATVTRRRPREGGSETTLLIGYKLHSEFL